MTEGTEPARRMRPRLNETGRVEGFSDAVFAISATLLVLDLRVPAQGEYLQGIVDDWSSYVAYLASFLTIASIWLHHHNLFSRIARIDAPLVVANLLLLLGVSVLPWPTSLMAASLRGSDRADQLVAVAVYAIVSIIVAAAWSILSASLARRPELLRAREDTRWMRTNLVRVLLSAVPVLVAVPIAAVAPLASLALYVAVPLYFLVTSIRATEADGVGRRRYSTAKVTQ